MFLTRKWLEFSLKLISVIDVGGFIMFFLAFFFLL